jgi:hypothetical protein
MRVEDLMAGHWTPADIAALMFAGRPSYEPRGTIDGIEILEHRDTADRRCASVLQSIREENAWSQRAGQGALLTLVLSPRDVARLACEVLDHGATG